MNLTKYFIVLILATISLLSSKQVSATIVEFQTNFGNFQVNLYDNNTPETVENFLSYLNNGDYADVVIHRSVANFITQGGGFFYPGSWPLNNVASSAAITNEPVYSNVRGSIAMAKLGGNVNSATNQWFFNLADNSANLDAQNGGFTVFGEVMASGMDIIDDIAALPTYNLGGVLGDIPLQNFTTGTDPDINNLVIITNIVITDSTIDTAAGLNPPLAPPPPVTPPPPVPDTDSGGGGSFGFLLLALMAVSIRKVLSASSLKF